MVSPKGAFFRKEVGSVYEQANDELVCSTLSIEEKRERMLTNCRFLRLIYEFLTRKKEAITSLEAVPATLRQRVLTYNEI